MQSVQVKTRTGGDRNLRQKYRKTSLGEALKGHSDEEEEDEDLVFIMCSREKRR